jgi:Flp pilus assembly protein TadD
MSGIRLLKTMLLFAWCGNFVSSAGAQSTSPPAGESPAALARYEAGKDLAKKGDHLEALAAFDDAMRLGLKDHHVHNFRGESLFQLKRFNQAVHAYTHLIELGEEAVCDT